MEIEEMKLRKFIFAMRGLKNKGLIQISEDKKTGDFILLVGKEIKKKWGIFNLPQGLWRAKCKKDEVKEVVDNILTEKILT
ncbi:hypothetical protein ACFLVI_03525 [Chloroflexota bacterium]